MFSDPVDKMDVDEIFETYKETSEKNPKIDVILEHYLSLVGQLKKDLDVLKDDLKNQKKAQGKMSNSLEELVDIQKLSQIICENQPFEQILTRLDDFTQKFFPHKNSEIFLLEENEFNSISGKPNSDFQLLLQCAKDEGILSWLWEQGHPIIVPLTDFVVYEQLKNKKGNVLIAPMIQHQKGIGVYLFHSEKDPTQMSLRDLELLNIQTQQAALAIQFTRMNDTLKLLKKSLKISQQWLIQMIKFAAVGEIAGGIAHEINNPLQVIMGNVQMARMGHRTEESLEQIEQQSLRIANIVRGLLSMARRSQESELELLELNSLIVNTLNLIRGQIEKRNIKVTLDLEKNLPIIKGGSIYFQQIFLNFLLHSKMQIGENGAIEIKSKSGGKENIIVEFKDSGIPMPKEYIQKVLDPFSDLENSSELNLGLTVSVQMIRDIGGTIEIESGKQSGNKVIIDIPKSLASEKHLDEEIASLG